MSVLIVLYILTTALVLVYLYDQWHSGDLYVDYVTRQYQGRDYTVKQYPLAQQNSALQRLHQLYLQGQQVLTPLAQRYPDILATYQAMAWKEGHHLGTHPAYTINKGDIITICLRQPQGQWVDNNTLMYVLLHELAHLITQSYGHTSEFWTNLKLLTQQAVRQGLYQPVNYQQHPVKYCGMTIGGGGQ